MTILDRIVETKRNEVAATKRRRPLAQVRAEIEQAQPPRDFLAPLTRKAKGVRLIGEIKKASPSAGLIVPDFDPVRIAQVYANHGAAALSVLTDETYFQGRMEFIDAVKRTVELPVLRKDFIVDKYQIYETRAAGADAILFIAEVLGLPAIADMVPVARELGLSVLIEVHTEPNLVDLLDALGPPAPDGYLLGINNRDLAVQRTNLSTTIRLAARLPKGVPFVSESGITTRKDVLEVERAGACAILVGESLLRADDLGKQIAILLGR